MSPPSFAIDVGAARTTARVYAAADPGAVLVLAHGAGAPQTHPWMVGMSRALSARGITVVTFNFIYSEDRRRTPDRNPVLEATWRAAIDAVRARRPAGDAPLFLGGKSMGGRIASQVAASADPSVDVAGLVLLGYPLHPPGKPDRLRADHLPHVRAPMLFVQGSRDGFGKPEELAPILAQLAPGTRLFVVEGGDHSFTVPSGSGRTPAEVTARVADEVARFVKGSR